MRNILCAALILFGCAGVFAQEKTITQTEFEAVYQNSSETALAEKWKGKSYRRTIITESSVEGRPNTNFSSKNTVEYASPTINRGVYETSFGVKASKIETIKISDKTYTRKDSEVWKEGAFAAKPETSAKLLKVDNAIESQTEYKFLGSEKLNNQNTSVYAKITKTKRIDSESNKEVFSVSTTKYWLGEDGTPLKSDMKMESRTGDKVFHSRVTQIWELDPNIKIEAPPVN